jgi:hypothetical protein
MEKIIIYTKIPYLRLVYLLTLSLETPDTRSAHTFGTVVPFPPPSTAKDLRILRLDTDVRNP